MVKKASFSAEYKLFCRLLREARVNAGLSQEEVAKRLNRPQSYVSKYESGERRLDVIEFMRVVKVLEVAPENVLKKLS
jgi:transcriptional regulator with XRE-family HTH domain